MKNKHFDHGGAHSLGDEKFIHSIVVVDSIVRKHSLCVYVCVFASVDVCSTAIYFKIIKSHSNHMETTTPMEIIPLELYCFVYLTSVWLVRTHQNKKKRQQQQQPNDSH